MSDFDIMIGAESMERLPYLTRGSYLLEILWCRKRFSKKKNTKFFIVGFNVLERYTNEGNEPGTKARHTIDMGKPSAGGNILNFLAGALNKDAKVVQANPALGDEAVADDQPLRGIRVMVEGADITTGEGKPFTVFNYSPAPSTTKKTTSAEPRPTAA